MHLSSQNLHYFSYNLVHRTYNKIIFLMFIMHFNGITTNYSILQQCIFSTAYIYKFTELTLFIWKKYTLGPIHSSSVQ